MRRPFRAQMDLFMTPTWPADMSAADRRKVVALLQALLREAATKPAGNLSATGKKGAGNE